jgi:ABC-type glycerol-3-phosphate transport system substrate-binding protein
MKKNMKKLISFGLVLSILLLPGFSMTSTKTSATAPKVTVKLGIWPEATLKDDIKMHQAWVKEFNQKYPNVTIVPDYYK